MYMTRRNSLWDNSFSQNTRLERKKMDTITQQYEQWCLRATADPDLIWELISMKGDQKAVTDAFYQNLAFGTGGLRGIIGAGTNRMNLYTVSKASQGLADYIRAAAGRQMDGQKVVAPAASAAESGKGAAGRKRATVERLGSPSAMTPGSSRTYLPGLPAPCWQPMAWRSFSIPG